MKPELLGNPEMSGGCAATKMTYHPPELVSLGASPVIIAAASCGGSDGTPGCTANS